MLKTLLFIIAISFNLNVGFAAAAAAGGPKLTAEQETAAISARKTYLLEGLCQTSRYPNLDAGENRYILPKEFFEVLQTPHSNPPVWGTVFIRPDVSVCEALDSLPTPLADGKYLFDRGTASALTQF